MSNVVRNGESAANNATTANTFGRSVESQAQIEDAARTGSEAVGQGEALNVYRLEPIAEPNDPRWDNSPGHGNIVVDARIVAASKELDFMEVDTAPADDVTTINASAFRDDKLYTVIEIEHGRRDLRRGVIDGSVSVDTIISVQV